MIPAELQEERLLWNIEDESIAIVSNGEIKGLHIGETNLIISHGDISTECC